MADIDVLITFAEKDNETSKKSEQGWVTQFRKFLELMLFQVLGTKPTIVIKSEFDTATAPAMDNASILVAVLTKDFVQSGIVLDLVEELYKNTCSSQINHVFRVLKSPISTQEQLPRLRDSIGYDMYQLD